MRLRLFLYAMASLSLLLFWAPWHALSSLLARSQRLIPGEPGLPRERLLCRATAAVPAWTRREYRTGEGR